jgi:2-hydroxy-3-keto-5-methylthiopentenyl-1-phosphate phosphatase
MFETDERAAINPIAMYYLDKICELCKEKDIPLVLVSSPSAVNMNYPKHNTLKDYADKHGLDYIDFNVLANEINLDWSQDTGDKGDHINAYGGEKTTRYLMKYLKENYDLPDHRED